MIKLLESMKNIEHGWDKADDHTIKVLSCLINEFLKDSKLTHINFDDVPEVYGVKLSVDILHSVLKAMGYTSEFISENGWEYDCWYEFEKEDCPTLTVYGCCFSNNMTLRKKEYYE